ncbi:MAG TPA: NADH-quinone oxidoreductase subunit M, partial [Fibrella sp.]
MLTLSLILLPIVAAIAVLFSPRELARFVALVGTLGELALTAYAFLNFNANADFQFGFDYAWLFNAADGTSGIRFSGAIDGISLLPVVLTGLVTPLIVLSTFKQTYDRPNSFYALILFMQAALMGVFVARDGFLFYLFFEAALIPIYFLAALWGGENRIKVT